MDVSNDKLLFIQGQALSKINDSLTNIRSINQTEFRVFSQWGDDGIIDWLVKNIDIENKTFIEFGVENYQESNTRFLMMNKNWSGLVIDGSQSHIEYIKNRYYYWMYNLTAVHQFIDKDNINGIISKWLQENDESAEVGILHIDIDGNDYWIWEAIDCINPVIVIVEYNALLGNERAISIPYRADFYRTTAHHSNLYYGVSLPALCHLATKKGYTFIGCNLAGNNAYFVRNDKMNHHIPAITPKEGFAQSKFREMRNNQGVLVLPTQKQAKLALQGLEVVNVITGEMEKI